MEIIKCVHGHFYNPAIYSECPECAKSKNTIIDSLFRQSAMLRGFRQREKLASGSSGVVYRMEKGGKSYALKVIDCSYDQQKRDYAQTDIALMKKLGFCRNVVPLIDSDLSTAFGTMVLLLEPYMTTFEEYYKSHSMAAKDVLQLGIDICTALEDCWSAGVAHLDIQPKNLFVDRSGHFCLGDFSAALSTADLAAEQQLRGTLSYMAPEVYESRKYSQASDIYSLGMVLYCLLNQGNLPFMECGSKEKAVMTRLADKVPVPSLHLGSTLDQLLQWMLEVDVRQRCSSFRLLLDALTEARNQLEESEQSHRSVSPASPISSGRSPLELSAENLFQPISYDPPEFDGRPSSSDFSGSAESIRFCPSADFHSPPSSGAFFDLDSSSSFDTCRPIEPFGFSPVGDCPPSVFLSEPAGGTLFDSDSFATTCLPMSAPVDFAAPAAPFPEPVGGTLFDSDFFATTCLPMSAPVDFAAPAVPFPEPVGGTLFDSDSFATTCNLMNFAPLDRSAPHVSFSEPVGGTLFDSDSLATSCVLAAPSSGRHAGYSGIPEPAAPRISQVQFSAIAPKEARKEDYSIIQLFMYEQAFRAAVEDAIAMADTPVQEKRSGFQKVRDNTRVKIVLTCPDMPIDDNVQEQVWCGGYLQFDFAICPPEDFKKRQILLTAAVYFDDIPATRLMLTIKALASYEEEIELARQDIVTAFVSYASQDRHRVGALVQGMRKARPDMDIFFDVVTLRSGANWETTLYREILHRDILFLCWSRNALSSEWVEREWRYALEHKGLDAIEPIPLEQPDICPPPKELWSKHFNDSLLYIINR